MYGFSKTFPLGLGGLYAGWDSPTPATFKDQEDYVSKLLEDLDEGVLALLYKALYASGYRISTVDAQISKLRRKLEGKAP